MLLPYTQRALSNIAGSSRGPIWWVWCHLYLCRKPFRWIQTDKEEEEEEEEWKGYEWLDIYDT